MMTDKVNILVVDDRPDGLMAIEAVLDSPHYQLLKASSGQEALSYLLQYEEVVLILLDVQMPVMNGFETAQKIQQTEAWKHIPIIFLTAINKEVAHIYRGYECGAVDYLFKPFDPWVLKSKVAVFVEIFLKNKKIKEQEKLLREIEQKEAERQAAEFELDSRQRYKNLADAIPHIVWKGKMDGTVEYFNQIWCRYTAFTGGRYQGKVWQSVIDPADRTQFIMDWDDAMKKKIPFETECRITRFDGISRWYLVRLTFDKSKNGEVTSWIASGTDIQDRKEIEEKLEQRVRERTVELSLSNEALQIEMAERMKTQKEILEISEREQKRIGQDLHDGLAQHLAGISFKVKSLQKKVNDKLKEEEITVSEILELLKEAIQETKRLARGFYPIELERNGLRAALMELVVNKERMFNTVCECEWDPSVKIENRTVENHLYRIVQESIHNAIRHGKAQHIKVSVAHGFEDQLLVSIQDDGVGLPAALPAVSRGMGLRIMEYRTKMIGASLSIERRKEGGACVSVSLPFSAVTPEDFQRDLKEAEPAENRAREAS